MVCTVNCLVCNFSVTTPINDACSSGIIKVSLKNCKKNCRKLSFYAFGLTVTICLVQSDKTKNKFHL